MKGTCGKICPNIHECVCLYVGEGLVLVEDVFDLSVKFCFVHLLTVHFESLDRMSELGVLRVM